MLNLPWETFRDTLLFYKEADFNHYYWLCHNINLKFPGVVFHPHAVGPLDALDALQAYKDDIYVPLDGGAGEARLLMEAYSADQG